MSKVRILFMGTPEIARRSLESLLNDEHYEVVGVVTQPDRPAGRSMKPVSSLVKTYAESRGLQVFSPETVNTEEFCMEIAQLGAECGVVVAFGQLLGERFLGLFPRGCVNIHGSLLPKWRGAAPIQRSLMAGDRETGVSLQMVVRKLDAGPVLGFRKLELTDDMDAVEVFSRLTALGCELLQVELMDYLRGNLVPVPQDESKVTVAPKIQKSEARIDFNRSAREVMNTVRGLAMGPTAWCERDGVKLKLTRVKAVGVAGGGEATVRAVPGEVVHVERDCFAVKCGPKPEPEPGPGRRDGSSAEDVARISSQSRGAGCADATIGVRDCEGVIESDVFELLYVYEVQPESRPRMTVAQYLAGRPIQAGEVLR